jgi:serine/threonine protein kinase
MSLSKGDRLGPYEIVGPLGAGGMGEVYRAFDRKLNREIALKVLPSMLADDADYVARFRREAQILASLNHPNIAAVYGYEESNGIRSLVMELIEGPTLAQRMAAGPILLEEALRVARQIADALETAHDRGIVHRDLKPANVKITPEDKVKVLDFGLAKSPARESATHDPANSPTLTIGMTEAGMILGTAAYMSPEQARGKPVDKRADIWAFGVLLLEMLSGRRAYEGETSADIVASVVKDEVPFSRVPASTPTLVRRLLIRCLDKNPKNRLRDIGEARVVLDEVLTSPSQIELTSAASSSKWPFFAIPLLALIAVGAGIGWWRSRQPVPLPLVRFDLDLRLGSSAFSPDAVLSQDGSRIVFTAKDSQGRPQFFTRLLNQAQASPIIGTEGADSPFFSPDGQWLGFSANGKMKKVSLQGGAPVTLCDAPRLRGASWGDGFIVAALDVRQPLSRVPEDGGSPKSISVLENNEITHRFPVVLPGGRAILFMANAVNGIYEDSDLFALSLETGKRTLLHHGGYFPKYLPSSGESGFFLYMSQGVLYAAPMNMGRLALTGPSIPILEGISAGAAGGGAQLDLSRNGTLLFGRGGSSGEVTLNWLDSSGHIQQLPTPAATYTSPSLSPDGKRIALILGASAPEGKRGLWIYERDRDTMTHLSSRSFVNPIWALDGRHIVYMSVDGGLGWQRSNSASEEQILARAGIVPYSFSPNGKYLATTDRISGGTRIQVLPVEGANTDRPTIGHTADLPGITTMVGVAEPKFSANGRWLAYVSIESGKSEVYVRAFPGPGGRWQISVGGGSHPLWSPKASQLFYINDDRRITMVSYKTEGDAFLAGKPSVWSQQQIPNLRSFTPNYGNYIVDKLSERAICSILT